MVQPIYMQFIIHLSDQFGSKESMGESVTEIKVKTSSVQSQSVELVISSHKAIGHALDGSENLCWILPMTLFLMSLSKKNMKERVGDIKWSSYAS